VVSFTPRPLYFQGKSPWYPLDRRLDGPQSRSERDGEEKNSQPLVCLFYTKCMNLMHNGCVRFVCSHLSFPKLYGGFELNLLLVALVHSAQATGWMTDIDSRQGRIFTLLFATASRPALGPTQPPIHWVPGAFSLEVKRPERETDSSPRSSADVKNASSYTSTTPHVLMAWCIVMNGTHLRDVVHS
jgi:hypothetical protein